MKNPSLDKGLNRLKTAQKGARDSKKSLKISSKSWKNFNLAQDASLLKFYLSHQEELEKVFDGERRRITQKMGLTELFTTDFCFKKGSFGLF